MSSRNGSPPNARFRLDFILLSSGTLGALGVAAAAYHAHGLERRLDEEQMRWWGTAVFIQLVTLPVIVSLRRGRADRAALLACWLLLLGVTVFSGSLYAMALGAPRFLGAVTPGGGLLLIAGWLASGFSSRGSK